LKEVKGVELFPRNKFLPYKDKGAELFSERSKRSFTK